MSSEALATREFEFTRADFERVKTLIYRRAGITLNDGKEQLVYSRLARRVRLLSLQRFCDYLDRVERGDDEWQPFVNALTTNLTAFFRESHHFDMLTEHLRACSHRPLRIWSAAASTGEEPYSLAMTAIETFGPQPPVQILASDIDTQCLATAREGVYPLERVDKLPLALKRQYLQKGKGAREGFARVRPAVRELVTFRQINLLDDAWPITDRFDVIFCRNVMIYFDKPTQRRLLEKMVQVLRPDGLFFAGHSETFAHATDLITLVNRTVYRLSDHRMAARGAR